MNDFLLLIFHHFSIIVRTVNDIFTFMFFFYLYMYHTNPLVPEQYTLTDSYFQSEHYQVVQSKYMYVTMLNTLLGYMSTIYLMYNKTEMYSAFYF